MAANLKVLNNRTRYAELFIDNETTDLDKLPNIDRPGTDNLSTVNGVAQGSKAILTNSSSVYYRLQGDGTWVRIVDEGGGGGGSDVTKEYVDQQLSYKVDKVNGKSLSTNDFTDIYKLKLDGIEEDAEVNIITGITLNGSPLVPSNRVVALNVMTNAVNDLQNYYLKTETYTKSEVDTIVNAISTLTLDIVTELPTQDISTTTIYLIKVAGSDNIYQQYVYINNAWAQLGTTEVDLSNYYTKSQIDALLLAKQDVLIFDDIPTVSSNNPVKSGGIYNALAGKQDTLTFDNAPTEGSNNPVKSSGIYAALAGKQDTLTFDNTPTHGSTNVVNSGAIADAIASSETPVATTSVAGKVKPDGTTVTIDQDGTIHAAGGGGTQVQSDWNQSDTTAVDYIKNKPIIPDVSIATTENNGISKPDDLTIFINTTGTLRTKVWAGTLARYVTIRDLLPNDTTIIIEDSDVNPADPYYVNGIKIVSWATGSWADVSAMIDGHDAGKINIYDYWAIGDKRSVHVNAITGNPSGGLTTDIPAQDVYLVLMNEGYMSQSGIHYAVGQLDCLSIKGRINADPNATGAWRDSDIRTDLNGRYYDALPSDFKSLTKTFNVVTGESLSGDTGTTQTTQDKVALFAQKEIFGENTTQYYQTVPAENTALSQIEYYQNPENRIKYIISNGSKAANVYWQRSPIGISWGYGSFGATGLTQGKAPATIYGQGGEKLNGIAPFFCI